MQNRVPFLLFACWGLLLVPPAHAQYNQTLPWNYSVGSSSSFSAYVNGQLALSGSTTGTSVLAQTAAGGAILGHQKDILSASASASAFLTGDEYADVTLKVFGSTKYEYHQHSSPLTIGTTFKLGFDPPPENAYFNVGPFLVHVTIGLRGTAGVSYGLGLNHGTASASVTPFVRGDIYGMAGLDFLFLEVGVGSNLTLIDNSLPITAGAHLAPNYFASPPSWGVKYDFDISNKLTLLSGNLFVYASLDYWFGSKTWRASIFSWPGFKISNTLFNDGGWTSIGVLLPQLSSLDPPSINAGHTDFDITLTGSGFTSKSSAYWNASPLLTTYVSPSQLKVSVPLSFVYNPGVSSITVQTFDLLGGTSNALPFHIILPAPIVTRASPGGATAGGPSFTLTVDGSWLVPGSTIFWNSTPLSTTYISDSRLTATVSQSLIASVGSALVTVTQPPPYNQSSNPLTLPVFAPIPTLTSTRPFRVWPGTSDLTIHVLGTGFLPASTVYWSGARLQTTYVSAVQLDAIVPTSFMVQPGIAAIDVINPTSAPSNATAFTVAPTTYTAIEIPPLPGYSNVWPVAVNANNMVVGWDYSANGSLPNRAYSWTAATGTINLGTLGGPSAAPYGLNNLGQIVGGTTQLVNSQIRIIAFLYDHGVMTGLPGLQLAEAINASGQIAAVDGGARAVLVQPDGHQNPLGTLGYRFSIPHAINSAGRVVGELQEPGQQAFTWEAGQMALLPSLGGATIATALNDFGTVVGTSTDQAGNYNAVTWVNGSIQSLGFFGGPQGINNNGDIVGDFGLFSHGKRYDLNALLSKSVNGLIQQAVSIADGGQIVAVLRHPDNTQGAVLLKPDDVSGLSASPQAASLLKLDASGKSTEREAAAVAVATLTALQPNTMVKGTGTFQMTLTGAEFVPGTFAYWNGSPLNTIFNSASSLTATVPAGLIANAGYATVTAIKPGGETSNGLVLTIGNPTPGLTNISPGLVVAGSSGFTLTVTGTGFIPGSNIYWNGLPITTAYGSATQLSAVIADSLVASPTTAAITVVSPGPGGGPSTPLVFRINPPAPILSSLSPSSVVAGAAGFTLTLSGSGFDRTSVVSWNNTPLQTTFVSPAVLTVQIPVSYLATAGTASVTVTDTIPGSWPSRRLQFIISFPSPQLTNLSPNSLQAGSSDITLAVSGVGFVDGSQVYLDGNPLSTTYISGTQLTAALPAANAALPTTSQITVVNPEPSNVPQSGPLALTITAPPMIQDVTPAMARKGVAPITLTVRGSGFTSQSVATWNDAPLATVTVSATQLTATVPVAFLAATGDFAIRVYQQSPGGGKSRPVAFTVYDTPPPKPSITSLTPPSVAAGAANLGLLINGVGFLSTTTGQWNGTSLPISFLSSSQVVVHVPAANLATPGSATIRLQNPTDDAGSGGGFSNSVLFTVLQGSGTGVQIVVTNVLSRDASNNVVVQLTLTNSGAATATNVTLTSVRIGTALGTLLPQTLGNIPANSLLQTTVTVPASAGNPSAASSLTITGSYTGGTFTASARITLP